ncbi:gamma-glutamyltransferase [Thalassolituus oleivorans]|uniref:gamma-glutamyltransferase n=1 Tax=Thalassolituus oleivorans TaxID=187493 RepID=UPI0023F16576|nr:gamma-glutamyltransferase [Thalassolituus oleivorans]
MRLTFKIRSLSGALVSLFIAFCLTACAIGGDGTVSSKPSAVAVASAHPLATQAGLDVLAQGGNAFDAAIAVAASLGVVEPYSAGMGGGGFWLLYSAKDDQYHFVDAREMAPSAADKDYYLNKDGTVNRDRATNGPSAAGIPGQAAAFAHLAGQYGKLPLAKSLAPAIKQARQGFAIDDHYRKLLSYRLEAVRRYPSSASIFLNSGQIPDVGYKLVQRDLATTLEALARAGHDGFYQGPVAQRLVTAVQRDGGDWTMEDLANYKVVEREPIRMTFGNAELISAPPPSSGGIAIAQMLQMLDLYHWQSMSEADQTHLLIEVMRRAYRDRAEFLGDPDFVDVPTAMLLDPVRAHAYADSIDMTKATPSLSLKGPKNIEEGFHTTHLSVLDKDGNRVSATLSINLPFGSAYTAAGTGVVLNNEMDDFSAKPGAANAYGLVGNAANAIAPGKRPLSSMSPSMMVSDDQVAILGTPGGSRIISMVLLGLLEHQQNKPVEDWVRRKRIHHQYLPDVVEYEPGALSQALQQELKARGHTLKNVGRAYGNMQAILWDRTTNKVTAAADSRGIGSARVVSVAK